MQKSILEIAIAQIQSHHTHSSPIVSVYLLISQIERSPLSKESDFGTVRIEHQI